MVPRMGSFRHTFAQRSKERLLSQKDGEWDFGLDSSEPYDATFRGCFRRLGDSIAKYFWEKPRELVIKAWDFGRSDPRKIIFGGKVGLALILISVLMFLKEPFRGLSRYSVWAILTVVVVFEFSIGATFSKGFNRALGTLSAGGLALGVAELSTLTGDWEEMIIIISIFIAGFLASFIRLYPTMKPYEYGFRVFLITFCFIMVSGYRTREFIETAVSRFLLICLGAGVSLTVNICIYPIWAGEDLHNLVAKNFAGVAKSLEGCVNGYLQCVEYERVPSKILTYEASDDPLYNGYRSAVESKSQEDTLLGFAIWEPPHGPYKMLKYPWKDYVKLSGALRHCAFNVMALHGCILSEIQAPPERRKVFQNELRRVGTEGAKVLQELGNRVKTMTRLSTGDILMEVHDAAEELQKKIDQKSYLLVDAERWVFGKHPESTEITIDVPSRRESESSNHLGSKCLSETKLDLRYVQAPKSWDAHNSNIMGSFDSSQAATMEKQISWPVRRSFTFDVKPIEEESWPVRQSSTLDTKPVEEESRTYESASALSLATFSSLLIEFVARLQYLVDSFNELSEKANFKEPLISPVVDTAGFWMRLRRFRFMG